MKNMIVMMNAMKYYNHDELIRDESVREVLAQELTVPAPTIESPSTRTKYVAAGRFTRSSFRSSGGSRYCSAGEGNPATTDPDTFAFALTVKL